LFSGTDRNVCKKQTESEVTSNIKLDPQLLQTPKLERELNSTLHVANIFGTIKEYETPACKNINKVPTTTGKKLHATKLRCLTRSLVKKKKTVEMTQQFQSMSRPYMVGTTFIGLGF
jgi:hypothetical protein